MLAPENRKVLAFLRKHADETLLVVVNLSRYPQWVELDLAEYLGKFPVELRGNGAFPPIGDQPYRLTLGGHDGLWLSLSSELERQRRPFVTSPLTLEPLRFAGEVSDLFSGTGSPLETVLAAFIPAQRWFRSKARAITRVRLNDVVPLSSLSAASVTEGPWMAFVDVAFGEGEPETYALPLRLAGAAERPEGALLRIDSGGGHEPRLLCDASRSPEVAALLHYLAFGEQRVNGRTHTLRGSRRGEPVAAAEPIKPLGAEQSNTSFAFGQQLVGKLLRRVEPDGNLEVEILQALASAERRPNVPTLEARIDVEARDGTSTLWLSESYISNEGDAWQLAIDHAQRFYEAALSGRHGEPPPARPLSLEAAVGIEPDFVALSRLLGRRTAELHAALFETSRGDDTPKAFSALSSRAFYQSVRNLSTKALDALKSAPLPEPAQRLAREVLARKADLRTLLDKALSSPLSGQRMRVHGDYHLGQVLYTGSDFYIIDFEGEPARPPRERRRLRSPFADVAGMLRSFHYAAFGVLTMPLPGAHIRPEDKEQLEPWAQHFFHTCGRAFLSAYLSHADGAPFSSGDPQQLQTLLEIHLLEKALYELVYELNNRPQWAELPLRGLLSLLTQGY